MKWLLQFPIDAIGGNVWCPCLTVILWILGLLLSIFLVELFELISLHVLSLNLLWEHLTDKA